MTRRFPTLKVCPTFALANIRGHVLLREMNESNKEMEECVHVLFEPGSSEGDLSRMRHAAALCRKYCGEDIAAVNDMDINALRSEVYGRYREITRQKYEAVKDVEFTLDADRWPENVIRALLSMEDDAGEIVPTVNVYKHLLGLAMWSARALAILGEGSTALHRFLRWVLSEAITVQMTEEGLKAWMLPECLYGFDFGDENINCENTELLMLDTKAYDALCLADPATLLGGIKRRQLEQLAEHYCLREDAMRVRGDYIKSDEDVDDLKEIEAIFWAMING